MFSKISKLKLWLLKNNKDEAAEMLSYIIKLAGKKDKLKKLYEGFDNEIDLLASSLHPKFLEWATEEVVDGNISVDDIIPIIERFNYISKNLKKDKRDINQYSSILRLKKTVDEFGLTESEKKKDEKAKIGKDTDFIYKSNRFLVISPATREASCYWGKNTKWCISATEFENMFEYYSSKNMFFYFIIDKNADNDHLMQRIALPFKNKEIYEPEVRNAKDDSMTVDEVKGHLGSEWDQIYANIIQDQGGKEFTREGEEFALIERALDSGDNLQDTLRSFGKFMLSEGGNDFTGIISDLFAKIDSMLRGGMYPDLINAIINSNISFINEFNSWMSGESTGGTIIKALVESPAFTKEDAVSLIDKINTAHGKSFGIDFGLGHLLKALSENNILLDIPTKEQLFKVVSRVVDEHHDPSNMLSAMSKDLLEYTLKRVMEEFPGEESIYNVFKDEAVSRGMVVRDFEDLWMDRDDSYYMDD